MFCAISCRQESSRRSSTALTRLARHKLRSAIWKKATPAEKWSSPWNKSEMTITKIDNSQRTAAKVAGWRGLLTFPIVVFGDYVLLNPLIVASNLAATAEHTARHNTQVGAMAVCFLPYSVGVHVVL